MNKLEEGLVAKKFEQPQKGRFKQVCCTCRPAGIYCDHSCAYCCPLYMQIEAIGQFLEGCKTYGLGEKDLFVTLDLYELQNKNMVWLRVM